MSWQLPAPGLPGQPGSSGRPVPPGSRGPQTAFEKSLRRTVSLMHLLSQAAADRLGINPTDLNCLNILSLDGPLTAGQLAQATGLSTASITGVVDRLENAGYVRRARDASDRRRVVIHLVIEPVLREVTPVFEPLLTAWRQIASGCASDELELILGFQAKTEQVLRDNLAILRQPGGAPPGPPGGAG